MQLSFYYLEKKVDIFFCKARKMFTVPIGSFLPLAFPPWNSSPPLKSEFGFVQHLFVASENQNVEKDNWQSVN
jgi:hypothetical protein